jgi:hypothetical protein
LNRICARHPIPTFSLTGRGRSDRAGISSLKEKGKRRRSKHALAFLIAFSFATPPAFAASGQEPAPSGSFPGAPPQYTHFSVRELSRGFLALAFGSDLLIGKRPKGVRRYDHPVTVRVIRGGSIDRSAAMRNIVREYAEKVPGLRLRIAPAGARADVEVRLIDESEFNAALVAAFGTKVARRFIARTDPQCMTSVKSNEAGEVIHSVSFIIVDQGDAVFLDCAYHELLHAFGLSSHDQHNPWTTLNQNRMVGYLSVYDRALLTILYDPRMRPGTTRARARRLLPSIIKDRALASRRR